MHRFMWPVVAPVVVTVVMAASGCGLGARLAGKSRIPDTPDGTVKAVVDGLAKSRPQVAWDAMPKEWQSDVNAIVRDGAGKLDAEVYDKAFAVLGRFAGVLAKQKQFVLASFDDPGMAAMMPVAKADIEHQYDATVALVNTLVKSDVASVDRLKKLDVGRFLRSQGATMMADLDRIAGLSPQSSDYKTLRASLSSATVKVHSSTSTTAAIQLTMGDDVQEMELVKVGGKWVPREMADRWDANVADVRSRLATMTDSFMVKDKARIMATLASIDTGLTTIGNAKTKEEFQQAVTGLVGVVMAQGMPGR